MLCVSLPHQDISAAQFELLDGGKQDLARKGPCAVERLVLELRAELLAERSGAVGIQSAGIGLESFNEGAKCRLPIGPWLDRLHEFIDQPVIAPV